MFMTMLYKFIIFAQNKLLCFKGFCSNIWFIEYKLKGVVHKACASRLSINCYCLIAWLVCVYTGTCRYCIILQFTIKVVIVISLYFFPSVLTVVYFITST